MKFTRSDILKALPLVVLLLLMVIYKLRYKLHLVKVDTVLTEVSDTSFLNKKDLDKEIVASGLVMGKEYYAFDESRYPVIHNMDSGMDMINNDQFYIIKLYDSKQNIEILIAIRDFRLLTKIPFSYSFEDGTKILVTAFIKNKDGVNTMFGGTIHNNRGKLSLSSYNKNTNFISGELDADLDAVTQNGICDVRGLKFNNAILLQSKAQF